MKFIFTTVTVFGLFAATANAAPYKSIQQCTSVKVDQKAYDAAISKGKSQKEAMAAAIGLEFNQDKYDQAISAGFDNGTAIQMAFEPKFIDNSDFCVNLRVGLQAPTIGI